MSEFAVVVVMRCSSSEVELLFGRVCQASPPRQAAASSRRATTNNTIPTQPVRRGAKRTAVIFRMVCQKGSSWPSRSCDTPATTGYLKRVVFTCTRPMECTRAQYTYRPASLESTKAFSIFKPPFSFHVVSTRERCHSTNGDIPSVPSSSLSYD